MQHQENYSVARNAHSAYYAIIHIASCALLDCNITVDLYT